MFLFYISFFRTIEEEARAASQWCQEMLDDFGVNELTWTKSKAEEDLESLNKAYKTLDEFNTGGKKFYCIILNEYHEYRHDSAQRAF